MERVVLSISGGKDSAAAALHLREQGIEHERVFMDTGWEHPDLYGHLDYLEAQLGPIVRLCPRLPVVPDDVLPRVLEIEALVGRSPSAFVRWAAHKAMFPSRMRRWCTSELKVTPFLHWIDGEDVLNVVGIRADESRARAALVERESMPGAGHITVWRPLLRWSEADVVAIHARHGLAPCPLYLRGARRVGCWPCINSTKAEIEQIGADDRRMAAIRGLEKLVGDLAAERRPGRDRPAFFQAPMPTLTPEGPQYPCTPIDQMVEWSRTTRGGRQMRLGAWGEEEGCVRWGMCEAPVTA